MRRIFYMLFLSIVAAATPAPAANVEDTISMNEARPLPIPVYIVFFVVFFSLCNL